MNRSILLAFIIAALFIFALAQTSSPVLTQAATMNATKARKVPVIAATPGPTLVSPTGITAEVLAWILPLRDQPSRLHSKVLAKLRYRTMIRVLGRNKFRTWLWVQTVDGQQGWISLYYVKVFGGRVRSLPIVNPVTNTIVTATPTGVK
jgi:hypothetical protein